MPSKPKRPCKYIGCAALVIDGYCDKHKTSFNKSKANTRHWADWYSTTRWRKSRELYLNNNPLCVECERSGRLVAANVVDHITDHKGDQSLFWDADNWQALCKQCHDVKTMRTNINVSFYPPGLQPSNIPLTIVCGPSGAGKSYYVNTNRSPGDIVIDLDCIKANISNSDLYRADDSYLRPAIYQRNNILYSLSRQRPGNSAWFIVSAAQRKDRNWWRDNLKPNKVIVLMPDIDTCIDRLTHDTRRADRADYYINIARRWFRDFERDPRDIIIRG